MKRFLYVWTLVLTLMMLAAVPVATTQAQSCGANEITHVIQSGQNVFRISLRYGVSMQSIMIRNNIVDINRIYAGDTLCIASTGTTSTSISGTGTTASSVQVVVISGQTEETASADPNSDDYNWCSDPDVWGGRCGRIVDPELRECHWIMGWYLPRVEAGEFSLSDIDSTCFNMMSSMMDDYDDSDDDDSDDMDSMSDT